MTSFVKKITNGQPYGPKSQLNSYVKPPHPLNHSAIFKQSSHKTTLNILRQFLFIFKIPIVSLSPSGPHNIMRTSLPHSQF